MAYKWIGKGVLKCTSAKNGFIFNGEILPDTIPQKRIDYFVSVGLAVSNAKEAPKETKPKGNKKNEKDS